MSMVVELCAEGPAAVLRATGALDERGATQLHSKVQEAIDTGFRSVVLNLSGITNMTPDGLMLLETIRHDVALCDGQLILTLPQHEAAEVLSVYGLKKHLVILPSEKEALRRIDSSIPAGWSTP
ncbi:MAG TPA: STAS domain-containing protein [bacterium]|nr:STAS domain-containing protein [bacterium]